jgi:Bacterial toxin 44
LGAYFRVPVAGSTTPYGYYDSYSNIHYGYVGARYGFDEALLIAASHLPGTGLTDPTDDMNVRFGYKLWRDYGQSLTIEQFRAELGPFLASVQGTPHSGYPSKFLSAYDENGEVDRPC